MCAGRRRVRCQAQSNECPRDCRTGLQDVFSSLRRTGRRVTDTMFRASKPTHAAACYIICVCKRHSVSKKLECLKLYMVLTEIGLAFLLHSECLQQSTTPHEPPSQGRHDQNQHILFYRGLQVHTSEKTKRHPVVFALSSHRSPTNPFFPTCNKREHARCCLYIHKQVRIKHHSPCSPHVPASCT